MQKFFFFFFFWGGGGGYLLRHSAKVLSTTFGYSIAAMLIDIWEHWCRNMAGSAPQIFQ